MRRIRCSLGDPAFERGNLFRRQRVAVLHGRHALAFIVGADALNEQAFLGRCRNDGRAALARQKRRLSAIEAQLGGAVAVILAVAGKAIFRQNRSNIAVVIDRRIGASSRRCQEEQAEESIRFHGNLKAVVLANPRWAGRIIYYTAKDGRVEVRAATVRVVSRSDGRGVLTPRLQSTDRRSPRSAGDLRSATGARSGDRAPTSRRR